MDTIKLKRLGLAAFLIAAMAGCHVMLIGAYDQTTDESFQKVQTEITKLIIKIETNIQDSTLAENSYPNLKNDYITIEANIKSLQTRCSSLPKYGIISSQIVTISDNVELLKQFNKTPPGFASMRPIQIIDSTLQIQFVAVNALQNGLKSQKNNYKKIKS